MKTFKVLFLISSFLLKVESRRLDQTYEKHKSSYSTYGTIKSLDETNEAFQDTAHGADYPNFRQTKEHSAEFKKSATARFPHYNANKDSEDKGLSSELKWQKVPLQFENSDESHMHAKLTNQGAGSLRREQSDLRRRDNISRRLLNNPYAYPENAYSRYLACLQSATTAFQVNLCVNLLNRASGW